MPDPHGLPKDPDALARILERHCEREAARTVYRRMKWYLAWLYLNDYRRFDVFDPSTGRIVPHYLDEEGRLEYQSQALLSQIDRVCARLNEMDVRPLAVRQGYSLAGLRERSSAQLIADGIWSDQQIEMQKPLANFVFVTYGCIGLTSHLTDHPVVGLTADVEAIHPRELMPYPSLAQDHTKQRGLVRQRLVPYAFLKDRLGDRRITDAMRQRMDRWTRGHGETMEDTTYPVADVVNTAMRTLTEEAGMGEDEGQEIVRVRELWLTGPRDTVARYIVTCGGVTLVDQDLSKQEVYCPIGVARFMENGTFHGAGMFDLMYGIDREIERLQKSLFQNIRDMDRYGVVLLPEGQINERAAMRDVGRGLRYLPYAKDAMLADEFKPFVIQPHNAGTLPAQVAEYARTQQDALNPIQDLLREKGRVDSASGLQFLDEQISRAVTNPTGGVQRAWGTMYRAGTLVASRALTFSERAMPVNRLTTDLVGLVIDPEENTVTFKGDPLRNPSLLSFTVREVNPRSEVAMKMEAMGYVEKGLMDPDAFRLFLLREGINAALWMDDYRASWEVVVRNIIVLYGDGEWPGQIVLTTYMARPEFQIRVLEAFMSGPSLAVASVDVQEAFEAYRNFLIQASGVVLPRAVPNPDDAAIAAGLPPEMTGGGMLPTMDNQAPSPMGGGSFPHSFPQGDALDQNRGQPSFAL